ncbi:hypothetical protein CLU79DRAFT_720793 [Phycomyces nitens]|nr:hypothetical protein CLU79DRAFT_720793 [Phycomyces nitens]
MALGDEISHVQSRLTLLSRLRMCFPCSIFTENAYGYRKVPMYRVRPTPHQKDGNDSNENTLSYEIERWKSGSDYIGRASFQFFRYPFLASVIHWILVHIFCIVSPGNINPAIDRDFSPQSEQPLSADNPNVGETDTNGGLFENTDSFIWSRNSSNDGDIATDSVHPLDSVIISDPAKTPSHDQSNIPSTSLSGALRETTKSLARKSTRTNNANTEPESYFDIQPVEKPTNPLNIPGLHMNLQKPLVITARPYPAENIQCSTDETETPTPLDPPPISRDGRHLSLGDILPIAKDKPIPTPYTGLKPKRSSWSIVDMLNLSRHKSDFKLNPMNLGNERENDDGSRDTANSLSIILEPYRLPPALT